MIKIIEIKELTKLECLKLALQYSTSKEHQKSLKERIAKLENKAPEDESKIKPKIRKDKLDQQSFLDIL